MLGLAGYVLNVVSGLRYTRVSAEILFDMRLAVYSHLQRLSPRFYARTRMGDIVSRLNSDIGEIQRVAAEAALAWVGNVLFLAGCIVMLVWLDWKLALLAAAVMPLSLWTLVRYRARLEARVADLRQRSADIGSFLIETLQASTLVVTSNAQARERGRFTRLNDRFIDALMGMQRLTYLAGGLPGLIVSLGASVGVPLRRLARGRRHADARHVRGVHRLSVARERARAGADGALHVAGHGEGVVAARARAARCAARRARGA